MMGILNAKSSSINIFPISIDRLNSKSIYMRKSNYAVIDGFELLSEEQKTLVENSPTLDVITSDINSFYDPVTTSGSSDYHNGRALTEQNLSNIICKLTNNESYVLGDIAGEGAKYLEFIIKGHYFKLSDQELLEKQNLYVGVNFINTSNNSFEQLDGYDSQETNAAGESITISRFKQVDFSESVLSQSAYDIVLPLIINGKVPISSKFRFEGSSIENINGGTV